MALSSFGKILTVLDLFTVDRPIINVDIISQELSLSTPTSYRYLKELVAAGLLQRLSGTSGDYTLGSKIAVLDHISRSTHPLLQSSFQLIQQIVEKTELSCLLTQLNQDYCIDIHHELYKGMSLKHYGRGIPRPVSIGSSPKVIIANLAKAKMEEHYHENAQALKHSGFADDLEAFIINIKKIKKQGFYFSDSEIDPDIASLSVPIQLSGKEAPIALTLIGSKNRFQFINEAKLVETLQEYVGLIQHKIHEQSDIQIHSIEAITSDSE